VGVQPIVERFGTSDSQEANEEWVLFVYPDELIPPATGERLRIVLQSSEADA
jgi:hypothetical protein